MFKNSVFLIAVVALCGVAYADVEAPGACPTDIRVMPNYDPTKYVGLWYEYARYPYRFEDFGQCITATYTLQANGEVLVNNSMINKQTGQFQSIFGQATLASNAKLDVDIEVFPGFIAKSKYWVLDTDYTSYSCVYACQPIPILVKEPTKKMHTTYLWILTRAQVPTEEAIKKCEEAFLRNDISLEPLKKTDQSEKSCKVINQ